ncbi:zinc finger MYM-type protein 1-like [Salvia hispanica]|uniref:zinc finger MYM-type protein 1-like n=1 Tax=Salvia hispanica TaxID=49212 RepID=UPI0020090ADD|nr:zinc finger MYM-type protein 1-like [Salvia hispanica]
MDRYFKKLSSVDSSSVEPSLLQPQESSNENKNKVDLENLPSDPGERPDIMSYPPNLIEQVRRAYLLKGPCQPRNHDFRPTVDGNRKRKFVSHWFDEFKDWLEYSVTKEAAFCLYCYLFSRLHGNGQDAFVSGGFTVWRKKERLRDHVGNHKSAHNRCRLACEDLMNQAQHIEVSFAKQSTQSKLDYRLRLNATIISLRYLIMQGLPFRGHDESEESLNQGNFLEFLKVISSCNEEIASVVLKNAPENLNLTSPDIQRDIINAFDVETTKAIVHDMGNEFFSILVDECRDVSVKEQMGVVVRYVDKYGCVIERFLGVVHVSDTAATSLEKALDYLLSTYDLSISSLRGQGYDGASNMRGEFNGLKSLILKRNSSAYYVHCFAHQLQLTIVAVAKKHKIVGSFYNSISRLCNTVGGSCKRRDILREKQRENIIKEIASDEISTGRGLNQEMSLKRPGDTRWSSHYGTLVSLIHLYSSIVDVLEYVGEDGHDDSIRAEADDVLEIINSFEFVFVLHLMKQILGITHELSQVLQKKDQDIVNAMNLVKVAKSRLQIMREKDWDILLADVSRFCSKYDLDVLDMEDEFVARKKGRRRAEKMKNLHYYRVELFCSVIDLQAQELNQRFNEVNTDLVLCMSCFDPRDSFSAFDLEKLLRLARYYPSEFSEVALSELENQLENFIFDVRIDEKFSQISGISGLAQKMVSTRKHEVFPMVYLLVKLSLILPVATASVERAFSAMKIIKTSLRNSM